MPQKKKTTFAKLNREQKLRDKRYEKEMSKEERKRASADGTAHWHGDTTPNQVV